ncbi:MAG: ester cyclase [Bacteroidota bacterium]
MKNLRNKLMLMAIAMVFIVGCNPRYPNKVQQANLDKYLSFWNTGNFDGIDEVLTTDYEYIASPNYEPKKGIEAFKKEVSETRSSYPDFKVVIIEKLANKDGIAIIWSITGTRSDNASIKLNGKGISIIHFADNKIKDEWLANNNLLWLRQIGYSITPPAPAE